MMRPGRDRYRSVPSNIAGGINADIIFSHVYRGLEFCHRGKGCRRRPGTRPRRRCLWQYRRGLVDTARDIDGEDEFQVDGDILCRGGKTPDRDTHG